MDDEGRSAKRTPAMRAWLEAQKIALAPIIFQASRLLRDSGILDTLRGARSGLSIDDIAAEVSVPRYGLVVLLEAGLAANVVSFEDDGYRLTPTGLLLLTDESTRINMDVVQECCFEPAYHLEASIREARPVGLREVFGDWDTIYPALPHFPRAARESWLRWDHFYSDAAFPEALPIVFESEPRSILDVGGNTGKWAIQCANHSDDVSVTIVDLPDTVAIAERDIRAQGLEGRIHTRGVDLLDASEALPEGFDAIWMSQFLVCFSEDEVQGLLERAAAALGRDSKLYILDNFWDRQSSEIATFCLQAFSLYFTFLANGRSRMYKAADITPMVEAAGMKVDAIADDLGVCSSLMTCSLR